MAHAHDRKQRVGHPVTWIDLDGPLEEPGRLGQARRIVPLQGVSLKDALVCREIRRLLAPRAISTDDLYPADERADDSLYDLILHGKELGLQTIEMITPDLTARGGIDQLRRDPDVLPHAAHPALDDEADVQFARHAVDVDLRASVPGGCQAGPDLEHPPAGELGDDVLGDSLADCLLLRIAALAAERKYGDSDADVSQRRLRTRLRGCLGSRALGIERADETVAPSWKSLDVTRGLRDVSECAAELADDRVEAGIEVDDAPGPKPRNELLACHQAPGVSEELLQCARGPLLQTDSVARTLQVPGLRVEHPPIEAEFGAGHG